jgi:hypothetical protein
VASFSAVTTASDSSGVDMSAELEEELPRGRSSAAIGSVSEVVEFLGGGRSRQVEVLVIGLAIYSVGLLGQWRQF